VFVVSAMWLVNYRDLGEDITDDELRAMIDEFDGDQDGESKSDCDNKCFSFALKVGWRGELFLAYQNQCVSKPTWVEKSSYWAGDVVKNTVKSWNSQMNFHSVEIFPRDVNCPKRHHSGSTLLHMRACAMGSPSPTSTTLSHFWLLGSKYEHKMGPKTKPNTKYEFTELA